MVLTTVLTKYWTQLTLIIAILALSVFAYVQHVELANDATKLTAASALHQEDVERTASLAKDLTDQNVAIGELQAAQAKKEQKVDKALITAKVQEQKVAALLAPTNNKRMVSCQEAMPDVRAILKGLMQ